MGSTDNTIVELDALIVGAGFSGIYQLKKLRDLGYKVKLVESGGDYGGVWYWNRFPGSRVDIATPFYQLADPELWKDWTWTQKFPGSAEIRAYFAHVAKKWDLRPDSQFDTLVKSAAWQEDEARWLIHTEGPDASASTFKAKFFLPCVGFAAKRHIPDWEGIGDFQGTFLHPSYWPREEPDLRAKSVAIIGTGATGIQITQALAPIVGKLVIFQRTPSTAIPMGQVDFDPPSSGLEGYPVEEVEAGEEEEEEEEDADRQQQHQSPELAFLFRGRTASYAGLDFDFLPRPHTADPDPAARAAVYERLWRHGDFRFWLAGYNDVISDRASNDEVYRFWRDKVRARMPRDARARDLAAPLDPPYAFGLKRVPLEQGYYERLDEPHVHLVDASTDGGREGATPVVGIAPRGVRTADGKVHEVDFIVCATGFDALTGGLAQIDIRGVGGERLGDEHWGQGVYTYLGMTCSGFPNFFFSYGPQAPTPFCNGPTCAQVQGDWIVGVLDHVIRKGAKRIEVEREKEVEWRQTVLDLAGMTLLSTTKSWYMGDNIPGKPREPYLYVGGVPTYYKLICDLASNGYPGFKIT